MECREQGLGQVGPTSEPQGADVDDTIKLDGLIRDSWGDIGHLTVFVRREDAAPERRYSATVFDHENRLLTTVHAETKHASDLAAVESLKTLGYSDAGYGSKDGKEEVHR